MLAFFAEIICRLHTESGLLENSMYGAARRYGHLPLATLANDARRLFRGLLFPQGAHRTAFGALAVKSDASCIKRFCLPKARFAACLIIGLNREAA
jgi:hypothetical protein